MIVLQVVWRLQWICCVKWKNVKLGSASLSFHIPILYAKYAHVSLTAKEHFIAQFTGFFSFILVKSVLDQNLLGSKYIFQVFHEKSIMFQVKIFYCNIETLYFKNSWYRHIVQMFLSGKARNGLAMRLVLRLQKMRVDIFHIIKPATWNGQELTCDMVASQSSLIIKLGWLRWEKYDIR